MTVQCFCYTPSATQPQFTVCAQNVAFNNLTSTVTGQVCVFNCGTYSICVNSLTIQDGSTSKSVALTKAILAPGSAQCFTIPSTSISNCFLGGCVNADLAPNGTNGTC